MMPKAKLIDQKRLRLVQNYVQFIAEHLEAMQRDVHGLEYRPWKKEVDLLWKKIFGEINKMRPETQSHCLDSVRELWTSYVAHYVSDREQH